MLDKDGEDWLEQLARRRIAAQRQEIDNSLKQIAAGNPLGAETKPERRVARLATKAGLSLRDAEAVSAQIERTAEEVAGPDGREAGAEALQGPTIDFVGVEFLSRGRLAANAVGRVVLKTGRAHGTGFLVGPGLLLTNNHVIETPDKARRAFVEFDYEDDAIGGDRPVCSFELDPSGCFAFDPIDRLDFTLIRIGRQISGDKPIEAFGYFPLSDAPDKHMLGEIANIIQHPLGRKKQIVVRENNLISRDETVQVLHYLADTDKGSSGSPVCNNDWEPIALHHWGGPARETKRPDGSPLRRDINEGIRISAIVRALRDQARRESGPGVLGDLLALWDGSSRRGPVGSERIGDGSRRPPAAASEPRLGADGSLTWTFPVEISVRAPLVSPPASPPVIRTDQPFAPDQGPERGRRRSDGEDLSDRGGYEPGFIPGHVVPMPSLDDVPYELASNRMTAPGADPHELPYRHFSIVMNAERRLAAVTACNIDGSKTVSVNRRTKTTNTEPTLGDLGSEASGPESSDDFRRDPRVLDSHQMGVEFYRDQRVPGHEKPPHPGENASDAAKRAYRRAMSERTARMFQKGHIIMRGDPAWGSPAEALEAEQDTFFYTNAAPQLGFFNQGSPIGRPGAKGSLRWRAVETYVLRNAFTARQRICVFAGPVFGKEDLDYRERSKVPLQFWKVAVWAERDGLRSIALLADQGAVLKFTDGVPEALRPEQFDDEEELARVTEFLSTVEEIEGLTRLNFGDAVRDGDVRAGAPAERSPAIEADASVLAPRERSRHARARARRTRPEEPS